MTIMKILTTKGSNPTIALKQFHRYLNTTNKLSLLNQIELAPPDKILGLTETFNNDVNPSKVNLTVGIYKDNHGKVTTFPSIAKAQKLIDRELGLNKNLSYLPIKGGKDYAENVKHFLYDESCSPTNNLIEGNRNNYGKQLLDNDRISFAQTLSGTGALAISAKFLALFISKKVWIPNFSWANHMNIFNKNGFRDIHYYSYYDVKSGQLTVDAWLKDLKEKVSKDKSPEPHCIILHACCHNPTGLDPTREDWDKIIDTINELKMIPIIDMAYQGLESGDLIKDAYLLRKCINPKYVWDNGLFLCQSFAKNMGLYGERVGSLSIVAPSHSQPRVKEAVDSQLKRIIRSIYSSPPGYGSRVASLVLSDPDLKSQWFKDVTVMVNRLQGIRDQLSSNLDWSTVNDSQQHGMFYFTRFPLPVVQELRDKYSLYLTDDGRLSLSGINDSNIEYICDTFKKIENQSK
ncbi:similar to Saccharomyces cerevisiae YKL106W AAT1 Mitochondrial aspartate aminotransferase, catalyzes the conversion of oxaloacetate to aspartate in aspartate and asparagine biosynthesis [Maudiozyma barnettii]|uniref:Aspartate aminotransferase n=1 Tax=Maudiozyma barnettii TaxID=61262 RepID=A0A8H2ZK33_9SACH|nr:aspartate transaminase AAT1 [Kazachstania barnettii]CAB4257147.1 similar to Saccharomyces cerevisiae YKL106W AAT1 Mitochondrial aspartate aminotransferase, catalyzes the conversion of oxaloacetate to aspartate in aspartate and asparagine biosynthesis [Kazachstania barnettii]CAD1779517.1 similar to Saccharomyces cerevisiae YKL106W AAT1 Mitochondrial aspartate aminotransferase, catalyzes the conversion of oxaloacetate to aspartate in aspartate and asparagine biosynthesis [Kazachstania barnettii]